jgi:hypothetical protein
MGRLIVGVEEGMGEVSELWRGEGSGTKRKDPSNFAGEERGVRGEQSKR